MKRSPLKADPEKVAAFARRGRRSSAESLDKRRAPLRRTGFGRRGDRANWHRPEHEAKREPACRNCRAVGEVHLHHIVPRSLAPAGRADARNLIPLCSRCHDLHHAGMPLPRSILTAEELAFARTLIGPGWLGRRYPAGMEAAA